MLELGLKIFISYLIGSINGALLLGRLRGIDIRKQGSGNAGGTNALRTQGKTFAVFVMIVDIGKGVLPLLILPGLALPGVGIDPEVSREWLTYACGLAVVVGHCYPVWFGFAGGKGAATAVGVLAVVAPQLLIPGLIAWVLVLKLFGYVGIATIAAGLAMPLYVAVRGLPEQWPLLIFAAAMGAFVFYTHRSNVSKLMQGNYNTDVTPWLGSGKSADQAANEQTDPVE